MDAIGKCAAAMQFEQRRLESAAENLANVETDGFRSHLRAGAQAPLRPTGRPYDLALAGGGALRVSGPAGDRAEIRSASFRRDRAGHLVDEGGRALLGANGAIVVPEGAQVRPDGAFVVDGSVVARVPLAHGAELRGGFLAGSDVNPISEMVEILDAQRQFETAQKTLTAIDNARGKATTEGGKIQ